MYGISVVVSFDARIFSIENKNENMFTSSVNFKHLEFRKITLIPDSA